jgi:uncharacterized repeat protein (TIGR01451 family)
VTSAIFRPWTLLFAAALACAPLASCSVVPGSLILTVTQKDLTTRSAPKEFKDIQIEVANSGSGVARGIVIRDALPSGFTYVSTRSIKGLAIRTRTADPPINTPAPTWGTWSIPAATASGPGKLILSFTVAVSAAPGKTPNFVEVSSDDTDPVAAQPVALTVQPTAAMELQVSSRTPVAQGQTTRYTITVRNTGTAAARGTFISAALPAGFVYAGTAEIGGNSARIGSTDPIAKSLLPSWGTWDVPAAEPGSPGGTLRIAFDAGVAGDAAPGNYKITVTITYNDLPAQTIADQGQVTVVKRG